ncbi:MAG: hypothetical protein AAGE65_14415 [Planctomycetota bacterium]
MTPAPDHSRDTCRQRDDHDDHGGHADHDHRAAVAVADYLSRNHARCPACRYDLFGTDGRACPECGLELTQHAFRTRLKPGHDERVSYLRGLCKRHPIACPACAARVNEPADLACPGCGEPLDPWQLTPAKASARILVLVVILIAALTVAPAIIYALLWLLNIV